MAQCCTFGQDVCGEGDPARCSCPHGPCWVPPALEGTWPGNAHRAGAWLLAAFRCISTRGFADEKARSCCASPELLFQSGRTGTETAEAEAALAGGGCEIGIWAVRSSFAQVAPAIPTQRHQDFSFAAHQLVKVFFPAMLFLGKRFPFNSAFYPFVPAFPAPKRTASLPGTLAVLGITDHQGTCKSSPSSVSSASPILRKPNLEAHGGTYELQTIIPFCVSLHQPRLTCETQVSGG